MADLKLPKQDSATGRGIKTGLQAIVGFIIMFVTGLFLAIKGVPGCPEAVMKFVGDNLIQIASVFGVSTGLVSFLWNLLFRKDVKTY